MVRREDVMPTRGPFRRRRGDSGSVWSLGGHFTTLLGADDGAAGVALVEAVAYRSTEPPLHIHHREDEAWYILDGQMTFHVAEEQLVAFAGDLVFAPRGLPHAFTVDVEPTRVLVLATPAGFEHFALELGVPATSEVPPADLGLPPPEILGPIAERYGIEVVGPPIRVGG